MPKQQHSDDSENEEPGWCWCGEECSDSEEELPPPQKTGQTTTMHSQRRRIGFRRSRYRRCRDLGCCITFLLAVVGAGVLAGVSIAAGDPRRLLHGTDYKGRTCGGSGHVLGAPYDYEDRPFIAYPRWSRDWALNYGVRNPADFKMYGICLSDCAQDGDILCNDEGAAVYAEVMAMAPTNVSATWQRDVTHCVQLGEAPPDQAALPISAEQCQTIHQGCWVTPPLLHTPILYRCLPIANTTTKQSMVCVFPEALRGDPASAPGCVLRATVEESVRVEPAAASLLLQTLNTADKVWGQVVGDLQASWWIVSLIGGVLALLLSWLWVILLHACAGPLVISTMILAICSMAALALTLLFKGGVLVPSNFGEVVVDATALQAIWDKLAVSTHNVTAYQILGALACVTTLALCILVYSVRKHMKSAIRAVHLGGYVFMDMYGLAGVPVAVVCVLVGLLAYWVFIAASMISAGTIASTDMQKQFQATVARSGLSYDAFNNISVFDPNFLDNINFIDPFDAAPFMLVFHVGFLLWTLATLRALCQLTVSGAIGAWYFAHDDNGAGVAVHRLHRFPVLAAAFWAVRYQLGTAAKGAALLPFTLLVHKSLARCTRKCEQQCGRSNRCQRCLCAVSCCSSTVVRVAPFVTQLAYTCAAVKNLDFMGGGKLAIRVLQDHTAEFLTLQAVSKVITLLGKVLIACVTTLVSFIVFTAVPEFHDPSSHVYITSTWMPNLLTFAISYTVAAVFFHVYDIAVDAFMVCYAIDAQETLQRTGSLNALHMSLGHKCMQALMNRKGGGSEKEGVNQEDAGITSV